MACFEMACFEMAYPMHRFRQVRHCYPPAFVELALLLADIHGVRNTALALALPLSTFYRWLERRRTHSHAAPRIDTQAQATLRTLVEACERRGFELHGALARLGQNVDSPPVQNPSSVPADRDDKLPLRFADATHEAFSADEATARGKRNGDAHADPNRPVASRSTLCADVHHRLARARREIEVHYYSALSCDALARVASMSRYHFIRSFKISFGISPYQYLLRVRVRCAKHLLDTTQQPLDAICAAVGFENPGSLYTAFEHSENIGLSEYFLGMRIGAVKSKRAPLADYASIA
jgi:AraC-like DNA-binding protein